MRLQCNPYFVGHSYYREYLEYLHYQQKLALQRIHEEERQLFQLQRQTQCMMGAINNPPCLTPYVTPLPNGSSICGQFNQYTAYPSNPQTYGQTAYQWNPQTYGQMTMQGPDVQPNPQSALMPINANVSPGMSQQQQPGGPQQMIMPPGSQLSPQMWMIQQQQQNFSYQQLQMPQNQDPRGVARKKALQKKADIKKRTVAKKKSKNWRKTKPCRNGDSCALKGCAYGHAPKVQKNPADHLVASSLAEVSKELKELKAQLSMIEESCNRYANKPSKSQKNNTISKPPNQPSRPDKAFFSSKRLCVGWQAIDSNWTAGSGFQKNDDICYLNSMLQALFHVPSFVYWLISDMKHRESRTCDSKCLVCAVAITLIQTQNQKGAFAPMLIINRLNNIYMQLKIKQQKDAHKFLVFFIEQMVSAYEGRFENIRSYKAETTPLHRIFGGSLLLTVSCNVCKIVSTSSEHIQSIKLDITNKSTVHEALDRYFESEMLEEGCDCESCEKKVSATKRYSLERTPVVLCIHVQRSNVTRTKKSDEFKIDQNLDLEKHLAESCEPFQNCKYKLASIVTHIRYSSKRDRYMAIGLTPNGNYCQFDDTSVSTISTDDLSKAQAYVIFYELVSVRKPTDDSEEQKTQQIFNIKVEPEEI